VVQAFSSRHPVQPLTLALGTWQERDLHWKLQSSAGTGRRYPYHLCDYQLPRVASLVIETIKYLTLTCSDDTKVFASLVSGGRWTFGKLPFPRNGHEKGYAMNAFRVSARCLSLLGRG